MRHSRGGAFLGELRQEARWLRGGWYPDFVTAARPKLPEDDVPVFVFHTIEPQEFEAQLSYLAENGYVTLTCDGFLRHLTGEAAAPPRSVLLTIDDGRASVWKFGLPLLRKFGATAAVFLIPGYVRHGGIASPTSGRGRSARDPARRASHGDAELMTWPEIERGAETGSFDFQAHTLYHHRVPVGPRIVDHVRPTMAGPIFDLPVEQGLEEALAAGGIEAVYGAPLYENDSLMSGRPLYRPHPELARVCIEHVASAGGEAYFRSPSWRGRLRRVVDDWVERHGTPGALESDASTTRAMIDDLRRARLEIEKHVRGQEVRHLCLPYTIGSARAIEAAREVGYRTCFWGVLPHRNTNRPGQDPYHCPRLKADYITRLPGRGRRSLRSILADKLKRRLSGRPVY